MNIVAPGYVGPITLVYNITGRAAHLTFKVVDPVRETTYYGPSGTGVEEDETYIYTMDGFTFPSVAGSYRSSWYDDGVLIPDSVDEFQISYTPLGAASPSGSDLTALSTVKNWLGETDTTQDSRLQQLIAAASKAVMAYCQREFAPISTSTTRTFPLLAGGLVRFGGWDLQAVTGAGVQIDTDTASTPTTISDTQYQLGPVSKPNGVYTYLRFYTFAVGPILRQAYGIPRQVAVTGTWGWPSIPADVEQAAIITVAKWFKRDQVAWSSELPDPSTSPLTDGLSLPYDARVLLAPYRRPL